METDIIIVPLPISHNSFLRSEEKKNIHFFVFSFIFKDEHIPLPVADHENVQHES